MKEIIIDGINVAGCKYYHYKGCTANNFCKCGNSINCYFKQLKRLEKENEELRQVRKDLPDIQSPYVILYRQIKQENEKLKEEQRPLEVNKHLYDSYCKTHCNANDIAINLHKEFDFIEQQQIIPVIKEGISILRFQRNQYKTALEEIREKCTAYAKTEDYIISETFSEFLEIVFNKADEVLK